MTASRLPHSCGYMRFLAFHFPPCDFISQYHIHGILERRLTTENRGTWFRVNQSTTMLARIWFACKTLALRRDIAPQCLPLLHHFRLVPIKSCFARRTGSRLCLFLRQRLTISHCEDVWQDTRDVDFLSSLFCPRVRLFPISLLKGKHVCL